MISVHQLEKDEPASVPAELRSFCSFCCSHWIGRPETRSSCKISLRWPSALQRCWPQSRRSWPPMAERSGAGSRPRRHGDHGAQASPGSRPLVALPLPITPSHGSHGASRRARRARREPWGLSPPGARGRADLPGDRAAAGGRGPPIPKGGRAGKENRFDNITSALFGEVTPVTF